MKWLLLIPAILFGGIIGIVFFAMLPGILLTVLIYGPDAFGHFGGIIDVMARPAVILGALLASVITTFFLVQ